MRPAWEHDYGCKSRCETAKFFDRVNHDILIDRLKRRIDDIGVIRLFQSYLNSGIMDVGVVVDRHLGTHLRIPVNVTADSGDRDRWRYCAL